MKTMIALNGQRKPNRGRIYSLTLADYDKLIEASWLAEMIDNVRDGDESVKGELPFRAAHYGEFKDGKRTQKNAVPETFLFQTTVDVDDKEIVDVAIERAMAIDKDETSIWKGMLLHAERSARDKLHLDIRMPIGMTIEETQREYCKALDIPYDEGCISCERFIYVTDKRQEIYRHAEWYAVLPEEELEARRKAFLDRGLTIDGRSTRASKKIAVARIADEGNAPSSEERDQSEGNVSSTASPSALRAFDLCVKTAGLSVETMDVWGVHNWHTNLMAVLSVGLPKLMTKEQLRAVVRERLPNYGDTEDCRMLVDYFYEKYSADKGFMSVALRDINAKAQRFAIDEDETQEDKDLKTVTEGWNPPTLPKKLPRLMELLVSNYDPRFKEMLLLSSLPILSALGSHFRAKYINGLVIGPQQYVSVIGGSGKGKKNCTLLYNDMIQHTLKDHDEKEWEKVSKNAELRDRLSNAEERPSKYHPKLRLFETTSKSSILDLQTNLGKNGMLLGFFSEADALSSSSRTAYSDISVLLRKGWDMDIHRQYYMSDSTCNTCAQMNISLLMAGTVRAMLERMFSDENCESGLMQRFIPVLVPETKRSFRPPLSNMLNEEDKAERDALLLQLYQKDLELGEDTELLDTPLVNNAIGEWFDELEERYNDGMLTEAEADLSHRCGEFMLRAAIPLIALYGEETKEIVNFCRWVGEMAHYNMCRIFGMRVQKELNTAEAMLTLRNDARKTAEPLLSKLPEVFTTRQLKELRAKEGQNTDVRMLLSRYCKIGKLEKIGRGLYKKLSIVKCNM